MLALLKSGLRLGRKGIHTPRLHIKRNNTLSRRLSLALLLLPVLLQSLLLQLLGLLVHFLVLRAEEIDVVVSVLLLIRCLGVDGELRDLGSVRGELLAGIAGERGKVGLEGGDVLVPAVGVGVLLDWWLLFGGLEAFDVRLGGAVALFMLSVAGPNWAASERITMRHERFSGALAHLVVLIERCLKPPHKHGPIFSSSGNANEREQNENDLPNNVAASLDPAVERCIYISVVCPNILLNPTYR